MSTKEGELSKNSLFSNNRIEMMSGCSSPPLDKNSYHPSKYPSAAVTPSKGSVSILDHVLMMHNLQLEETQLQLPNIKNNSEEIRRKEKTNGKRENRTDNGHNNTGYTKLHSHQLSKISSIIEQDLTMNHVVQHLSRVHDSKAKDREQYYKEKETKFLFQGDVDEINQIENAQLYCEPVKRGNSLNYRIKAFGNDKYSKDEGK